MTIEAITQFMLLQGPSQAEVNLEWDSVWNLNKKVIDPVAPRHVALEKEKLCVSSRYLSRSFSFSFGRELMICQITSSVPVTVISGEGKPPAGQTTSQSLPKHKKNPEVGNKTTYYADRLFIEQADAAAFAQDEEVTLMDWGNAIVRSSKRGAEGVVEAVEVELNLEGDFKKTKKKVTWLASPEYEKGVEGLIPVELVDYDYLITKKKLEEDDSVEALINPKTEYRCALLPPSLLSPTY
jgi:glutamyl-tRNA synthetase